MQIDLDVLEGEINLTQGYPRGVLTLVTRSYLDGDLDCWPKTTDEEDLFLQMVHPWGFLVKETPEHSGFIVPYNDTFIDLINPPDELVAQTIQEFRELTREVSYDEKIRILDVKYRNVDREVHVGFHKRRCSQKDSLGFAGGFLDGEFSSFRRETVGCLV
jgi:hypothetical protein